MTPEQRHYPTDSSPLDRLRGRDPYRVPEGFFASLEENVLSRAAAQADAEHQRHLHILRHIRFALGSIASAAAVALLILTVIPSLNKSSQSIDDLTPDQAFERLSDADQQYLIDNYRSDMAMDYAAL